ncbi:MAG: PQ-loop domain-containing transporter [Candidatus Nanoarchaeia archaeon]|nr:PQ-loop domain-containing transporter [Candidatus Nanoarchaeia archaeon]
MVMQYIGILGLIFIGIGWIPQVIDIIKTKKNKLNLGFAILYTLGSLALTFYAIQLNDWIFTILNGFAFLMSAIGLNYTIKNKFFSRPPVKNKKKI